MRNYLILIRPYGMLFMGFTPVFGAIANDQFDVLKLLYLLIIGLLAHIFTFVQNDYYDIVIDGKSKYVSNRPLVEGSITQKKAFIIFSISFLISIFITIFFLFNYLSLLILLLSFLFMTIYNKYSKKFFGMEYVLGIGVFSYGIFGALTVSNNISSFAIFISFFGFMQWLFSVGISANLKDVEYDSKLGIKTTPIKFGVKIVKKELIIPISFKIYAIGIKFIHLIVAALPLFFGYSSISVYDYPIPGVLFIFVSIIILYFTIKILTTKIKERERMLIYIGLQEGLALLLLPIVLMNILFDKFGIIQTIFILLLFIFWPLFWFRVLYGKKMIPLE
ncbi:hypothetical protein AYK20_03530 [Thermoplasmatales archaeon SG8-52-1]|nr:MAG: hypothetical protein AYK20_03530 [Thermoplasmatales archaeon SG8-52-1]